MAVNLHIPADHEIYPIAGIEIGVTEAGIRKADRRDLQTGYRTAVPGREPRRDLRDGLLHGQARQPDF